MLVGKNARINKETHDKQKAVSLKLAAFLAGNIHTFSEAAHHRSVLCALYLALSMR